MNNRNVVTYSAAAVLGLALLPGNAIGQQKPPAFGLEVERGFVRVSANLETSLPGVFAGGDCIRIKNVASTVMAVQDGKLAAAAIHRHLENTHG